MEGHSLDGKRSGVVSKSACSLAVSSYQQFLLTDQ